MCNTGIEELESKEAAAKQLGLILKSKSSTGMTSGEGETDAQILSKKKSGSREGLVSSKESKKKSREEEKLEKRRIKEEERIRRQNDKKSKKKGSKSNPGLDDFIQSQSNLIPLFVEKSIAFIEEEGLDSEGIYRVPGNRAHVDLLFQNFDEGKFFLNFCLLLNPFVS